MRNDCPPPLIPSTKEQYDARFEETGSCTAIVGWVDDITVAPGYWSQGDTQIWVFNEPDGNVLGLAV